MTLDLFSVTAMTALVVNVSGIVFIVDTLLRRDEGAGRLWSLAFLAGMLTTVAYLVWSYSPVAWWTVAAGNGAFVAATGFMWLGARRYNGRSMMRAVVVVAVGAGGAAVSALVDGPVEGGWSGAIWMFVSLAVLAALGAVECASGSMGRLRTSWVLAFVLAVQAVYYVPRTVVFIVAGPGSFAFDAWFGTAVTSALTVTLTIVAAVVASVLRAQRAAPRDFDVHVDVDGGLGGILAESDFRGVLDALLERARRRGESVAVIAVRIDDIAQISTAFGNEIAHAMTEAWREGVRRHAPAIAMVGGDGPRGLVVATTVSGEADARRQAARIYRGLFEDLGAVSGGVIPVIGVGVGLDESGASGTDIVASARDAAQRAAEALENTVLVGDEGTISAR